MSSDHRGCEQDIQDCSGAISSQFTREHQTHEQTEAAPGGISSAVGKCRLQKKAGFTERSVNWQPAQDSVHRSPRQQLFLMSRYVLHEQLFQDGLWHHVQENCFRVFQGSMRDLKSCRYPVALVKSTSLLLYLPMCTFRSTQHLHSWATAPQAAVCTIDGKYTSSTLLLA